MQSQQKQLSVKEALFELSAQNKSIITMYENIIMQMQQRITELEEKVKVLSGK